jgi:hypothetical protein
MARLRSLDDPRAVLFACLFASQSALLVLSPTLVDVARECLQAKAAARDRVRGTVTCVSGVAWKATAA